jgi:hypothetical protein
MNYSFFLFTQLYNAYVGIQYEYDLLYEDLLLLYSKYENSSYNNPDRGEYECMESFLMANESKIRAELVERKLCLPDWVD